MNEDSPGPSPDPSETPPGPGNDGGGTGMYSDILSSGQLASVKLDRHQVKMLSKVNKFAELTKQQKRALRRLGRLAKTGLRAGRRFAHHHAERAKACAEMEEVKLRKPVAKHTFPHFTPLLWMPVSGVILTIIEKRFVGYLPGLIGIATLVAIFVAVAVELLAMWWGRSEAVRYETTEATVEMTRLQLLGVSWAPAVVFGTLQLSMMALRFIRTGQVFSTIALTVAAIALFLISAYIHDMSTSPHATDMRRLIRREYKHRMLCGQAEVDHKKGATCWEETRHDDLVGPANAQLSKIVQLTSAVDALVRERGGTPGSWPIPSTVRQQAELAKGNVPDPLKYPPLPMIDAPTQSQGGGEKPPPAIAA